MSIKTFKLGKNHEKKEYYAKFRFSFTLECTYKGSLDIRKNLVKYLKENHYAFNNIQSEILNIN